MTGRTLIDREKAITEMEKLLSIPWMADGANECIAILRDMPALNSAHPSMRGVVVDENDPCPGHRTVTNGLVSCDLPYGHRGVPSEPYDIEKDGGVSGNSDAREDRDE